MRKTIRVYKRRNGSMYVVTEMAAIGGRRNVMGHELTPGHHILISSSRRTP